MEVSYTRHFGFFKLMNVKAVLRYALYRWPGIEKTMEKCSFNKWHHSVIREVVSEVGKECGIPDLGLRVIWIGNGFFGFCWTLPQRFTKASISQKPTLRQQVDNLKIFLYEDNEPRYFYSYMDQEPDHLKKRNICEDDAEPFNLKHYVQLFEGDRKAVVGELMKDMERLFKDNDTSDLSMTPISDSLQAMTLTTAATT